jgi:hypothetical protein
MATKSALTEAQRKPPKAVADEAAKGLELREQHGRGGTDVGRRRANQLANREAVSERDIKSMYSYFARHQVDKRGKNWGDKDKPSAGYIAWLLWGGEAGKRWIDGLHGKLESAE